MSKSQPGWKFEFRPDQTDTLKEVLNYAIESCTVHLMDKLPTKTYRLGLTVCRQRIQEILDEIVDTTG